MIQKPFQDPPFGMRTPLHWGAGAFFSITLFLGVMLVNFTQTLSLVTLPFSRKAFRAVNRFCANSWWGACALAAQEANGVRLVVTGDPVPMRENAIVLANHQQMPDIVLIMLFARQKERMGDLKWFVKDALKYVPGIGWGMLFLDCIYVKRNWEADRNKIHSIFSKFLRDQIPIWLISFAEGTRITEEKLKASQNYSREKGLPVLNHVLFPRTKGFVASVQGLQGHIDAIYDITIGYPEGVPTLWQFTKGTSKEFHIHVRRFGLNALPQGPEALSTWLIDRYVEKDQLMDRFYRTGSFSPEGPSEQNRG